MSPLEARPTPSAPRSSAPRPASGPPRSRWAFPLGSIAGIRISVHATFLLLLAWVVISHLASGQGVVGAVNGTLLLLAVFATVVIHELSHALVARRFGVRTKGIMLLPIGGVASLEKVPEKPHQELLVALAGPATNVALAMLFAGLVLLTGGTLDPTETMAVSAPLLPKLVYVNVSLAVFNLLPAFPMDGGRVLRAGLALWLDYGRATQIAARIGRGMALLLGLLGLFFNPLLVLIALFVWMGAQQESAQVQLKTALEGIPVRTAMITDFRTLGPDEPLSTAVALMLAGFQHEFPVMENGRLVGVLTRDDIVRGLSHHGDNLPVRQAMRREFQVADPAETLESAIGRMEGPGGGSIVVLENGAVLGMLTPENIGELLMLDSAAHRTRPRPSA